MSRKVLVIAPTHVEAQQWAHEHGIAYSDTIYVGPVNWSTVLLGVRGIEHVILGWSRFSPEDRMGIREALHRTEAVPFEGEAVDELCAAGPERS